MAKDSNKKPNPRPVKPSTPSRPKPIPLKREDGGNKGMPRPPRLPKPPKK